MPRGNQNNGQSDAAEPENQDSAAVENTIEALGLEQGNLNQTFPLPADPEQVFTMGDNEYKFCTHCHTPKPIAQIGKADSRNPGICVNCVNGINNYDKLAGAQLFPARPGWTPRVSKARASLPKIGKIRLADGTEVEGELVVAPKPKRARKNVVADPDNPTEETAESEATSEDIAEVTA